MSWPYRLFGIPRTYDEFVEKVTKKGIKKVEVTVGVYEDGSGPGMLPSHVCRVGLRAESISVFLREFTHVRMGLLYQTVIGKAEVEQQGVQEAIVTAEKLANLGFQVTINGYSIAEAREELAGYDKAIQQKRREYGLTA